MIISTIIESCRRGIDPYGCLCDVFTPLPSTAKRQCKELTPEA